MWEGKIDNHIKHAKLESLFNQQPPKTMCVNQQQHLEYTCKWKIYNTIIFYSGETPNLSSFSLKGLLLNLQLLERLTSYNHLNQIG